MSVLDRIFSESAASNDAAIAALSTQLTQAQQLLATQQGLLQALGVTDATQTTAIAAAAALDAAQTAAIAAAQAAADAAAAAEQALENAQLTNNTTQQAAIDLLNARPITYYIDLDVRAYTGGLLTPLTNDNFQDALEACIAAALAKTATIITTGSQWRQGYRVIIPPGLWLVTRQIVISPIDDMVDPMTATPALRGAGMHRTILMTASTFPTDKQSVIYVTASTDAGYVADWECSDFALTTYGSVAPSNKINGIHVRQAFRPHLHDLMVSGFQRANMYPTHGWGIKIDDRYTDIGASDPVGTRNNQHVYMHNVWSERNQGGFYLRNCTPVVMLHCHGNQNWFTDCLTDGYVMLYWAGGTIQGGGTNVYSDRWHALTGSAHPRVMSGWNRVVSSGSGASIATASGDSTTVTLPGASLTSAHQWHWLQLEIGSNPYNSSDLVSGRYLITEVIDATHCKVRKGTAHAATGSLTWKLRNASTNFIELTGRLYHEGTSIAACGHYATNVGEGQALIKVHGIVALGFDTLVESYQQDAQLIVEDNVPRSGTLFVARVRNSISLRCNDAVLADLDFDDYTREGLICRAWAKAFSTHIPARYGGLYTANMLGGGRLRTLCRDAGANVILDPRVTSLLALSGTNLTAWTGTENGLVTTLENAGQYPTYNASDPNFAGQPSIKFGGGLVASNTTKGMLLTIPAQYWPSTVHWPTLLVVGRATHAQQTAQVTCEVFLQDDIDSFGGVYWNHYFFAGLGAVYGAGSGQLLMGLNPNTDATYTGPHAVITGGAGRAGIEADSESTRAHFSYLPDRGWLGGRPKTLKINTASVGGGGTDTVDLAIAFIACFPYGISSGARERILDACANEFGVPGR